MYRKLLSVLLAALLLAAAAGESAPSSETPESPDPSGVILSASEESSSPAGEPLPPAYADYTLVASSDTYDLFLFEPLLSVVLRNRQTGALIASTLNPATAQGKLNKTWTGYTHSGFVLDVLTGSSKNYKQADLVNTDHTLSCTLVPSGFDADVFFPEFGVGLTLQVRLSGDEVTFTVPDASIREETEGVYIATVSLCPLFGATYLAETEGYMFIPDGNGALIYLTDKEERFPTGYSQLIYGSDSGFTESSPANYLWDEYETVLSPHPVIAPVFGMAHTAEGTGFLAVVEQGENRCSVEAHPNGVMRVAYNRCFARFLLRDVYKQPLNQSGSSKMDMVERDRTRHDLSVRYCLLSGPDASWVGMAKRYRRYLLDEGLVVPRDTAYRTRVDFLAEDEEKFLVGVRPVVMTSVEDVRYIYEDLRAAGVPSVLSEYRGWQSGGVWSLPVDSFRVSGALGGPAALRSLVEDSRAADYLLFPFVDALRMNASSGSFTYDAAKMVNKTTLKEQNSRPVYPLFYWLLPPRAAEKAESLSRSLAENGVPFLAVGGITDHLFSWSLRDTFFSRNDGAAAWSRALSAFSSAASLALEEPFQFQWKYMSAFLNLPLDGSSYMYTDEDVPFLSLALKGIVPLYSPYVNFEADKTEFFLLLAETGVYPSFLVTRLNSSYLIYTNSNDLYSTEYASYRPTILRFDASLRALAEKTAGAVIENYESLPGNVRRVTYSNGTVVYVNHSAEPRSADGIDLAPQSFFVGGETP